LLLPGFGHHLHPDGDPRAAALLALLDPPEAIARFIEKATRLTGLQSISMSRSGPWLSITGYPTMPHSRRLLRRGALDCSHIAWSN
jgi:hypothetical protein